MDQADIDSAVAKMGALFDGLSPEDSKQLLAALERTGAAVYRTFAESETDPAVREGLLSAASREEENASFLEGGG